ncbi:MAG: TolB family protein, partial [Actinomycetota bacterium]
MDNSSFGGIRFPRKKRIGGAVIAALSIGAAALLVWPGWLRPDHFVPTGGLVFQGRDETGYGIFTMDADGGNLRAIPIAIPRSVGFPRYAPDGRTLAFVAEARDGFEDL